MATEKVKPFVTMIGRVSMLTGAVQRMLPGKNLAPYFMYSTSSESQPVVKGSIAYRIPIYLTLEKDKTYSWCSCGWSKKQPFCDGSHKNHPLKLQPIRFSPPKSGRFLLCRCKQTNNRPYCDLTHVKTFIPEKLRKLLKIKL